MTLFHNVELYDWKPFFRELCQKIVVIGSTPATRTADLQLKVTQVFGPGHKLLSYPGIDPFSFLYQLAQSAGGKNKLTLFGTVKTAFGLTAKVPTDWIFPTPAFNTPVFFHSGNGYADKQGNAVNVDVLWRLFEDAFNGTPNPADFLTALSIKQVATTKLTQALFLINPDRFIGVDGSSLALPVLTEAEKKSIKTQIESIGLPAYEGFLSRYQGAFPGCSFEEINLFCYLTQAAPGKAPRLRVNERYHQISAKLDGAKSGDHIQAFRDENAVWPGDDGSHRKTRGAYALTDANDGDIMLVRKGTRYLGGIGIVIHNDFQPNGYDPNKAIRIIWLNKEERKVSGGGLAEMDGFKANVSDKTIGKFWDTYRETLDLLLDVMHNQGTPGNPPNKTSSMPQANETRNLILYGPPGTGKTFNTIELAVRRAEAGFTVPPGLKPEEQRALVHERFEALQASGAIQFVTFHQSMAYEDFVEGIKPEESKERPGKVVYNVRAGIFKKAAAQAAFHCYRKLQEDRNDGGDEQLSFDLLYTAFVDDLRKQLADNKLPVFHTKTGKPVEVFEVNKNDSIKARRQGSLRTTDITPMTKEHFQKLYDHFNDISEIDTLDDIRSVIKIQPNIPKFYALLQGLMSFDADVEASDDSLDEAAPVLELPDEEDLIRKFEAGVYDEAVSLWAEEADPVVLVIDEINRGNVSAIFGELITLLEDDKRWGPSPERLRALLPYSRSAFFVPANLFLIGTMNTADRSVEALDTALRRRFSFQFLPPLRGKVPQPLNGIDLPELFERINERIAFLLGADQQIGHAYFMGVQTEDDLKARFRDKILPLLQEYFYNDYGKIRLVLGDGFVEKEDAYLPAFAVKDTMELARERYRMRPIDDKFNLVQALQLAHG